MGLSTGDREANTFLKSALFSENSVPHVPHRTASMCALGLKGEAAQARRHVDGLTNLAGHSKGQSLCGERCAPRAACPLYIGFGVPKEASVDSAYSPCCCAAHHW